MKTRTSPRSPRSETSPKAGLILCAVAVLALLAVQTAQAVTLTWNNGAGNMQWDTASTNWGGTTLWNNATPDSATFSAAGVGTVSLTAPITVGALTFSTTGYTIQNDGTPANTLALKSAGDFSINVGGASVTATMDSAIMTNSAVGGDTIKTGLGTLVLSGTTSGLTKQVRLASGTISVSSIAALGSGTFKTYDGGTATNSTLLYTGSGETTGKSVLLDSNTANYIFTLDQSGTGVLTFSNFSVASRKTGYTLVLQGSNTGSGEISSAIGDGSGGMKVTKQGTNTWTLSGANTYTGDTKITGGTLALSNNLAIQNSAIDTSGAGVVTLSVTTPTFGGLKGSTNLASVITTGYNSVTSLTLNPGTGVSNTYSGAIANGSGNMTLTKTGAGTQVLSGANIYTGNTTLSAGTVQMGVDPVGTVPSITSSPHIS